MEINDMQSYSGIRRRAGRHGILVALVALGALSGCALPYRAGPLDDETPAHARPFQQEREGILLSADLVARPADSRALFHRSLPEQGVVPVVVRIENLGERTIVFRRERFTLRVEGEPEALVPLAPEDVAASVSRSPGAAWIGLPLIVPFLVARQEIAEFNFTLDQDYRRKGFPAYLRFAPGDTPRARVLFFRTAPRAFAKLDRSPVLEVHAEIEGEAGQAGKDVRYLMSLGAR